MRNKKGQFIKGHTETPKGHSRALGYKHNERARKKISLSKKGQKREVFNKEWINNMRKALKKRHKEGCFGFEKKEKNYKWNGGISPLYARIRASKQYRWWRDKIRLKSSKCEMCSKVELLEADHYPYRFADIIEKNKIDSLEKAIGCEELWNAEGRVLCRPCHRGF